MMRKIAMRSALGCVVFLASMCLGQNAINWQPGDVFVAVGNTYQVWRSNGTSYTLIESFAAGNSSGFTGGCAFDSQFNLYGTNSAGQVLEFSNLNHTAGSPATFATIATPTGVDARSIVFDASGNFYVGSSLSSVVPYTPSLPVAGDTGPDPVQISYTQGTQISSLPQAADQLDLGTDQTSLFFTSANPAVNHNPSFLTRVDLTNPSNNTPTALGGTAWAVRLLTPANIKPGSAPTPINGSLVADDSAVLKLDSSGNTVSQFSAGGNHSFRFLAFDPDGQNFWVGDFKTGNVYRVSLAKMKSNTNFTTNSSTGNNPMGGVCVFGGQQLNIVPLQFAAGSNVTATAAFGDPEIDAATGQPTIDPNNPPAPISTNYHTWSATVDKVNSPGFTLVISATEQGLQPSSFGPPAVPLLDRFDEYFCGQAGAGTLFGCGASLPDTGPTLVPIPYADQMAVGGIPTVSGSGPAAAAQRGSRVVYRVENPPATSLFGGNFNVTVHFTQPPACASITENGGTVIGPSGFTTSGADNCYVPPQCSNGFYVSNPRFMNDPSEGGTAGPPPTDYSTDHEFALDTSLDFLLDTGMTGSGGRNDHIIADRCPQINPGAPAFAQAVFNSPVPKSKVSKGSSVPVKVTVTDANGNAVTNAITSPNGMSVNVTDQNGNLEFATPRSFSFFTQNGGAGGTYSGNLNTTGLASGLTTLCVTSIDTTATAGSGQFPPICTQFTIK